MNRMELANISEGVDFKLLYKIKCSGIYKISSTFDDRCYVGSACNLYDRYHKHKKALRNNSHFNGKLGNFVKKYSLSSLTFEIIEYCSKSDLIKREQYYLDTLKPCFNILAIAGSRLGFKSTPETIKKLSESHVGYVASAETRKKLSEIWKGKKHTEEAKRKMSDAKKGRLVTPETLLKMSIVQRGKKMSKASRSKMAKSRTKINPETAMEIDSLHKKGFSHMKISLKLKIGRMCVFRVLNRRGLYTNEYIYGEPLC